LDKIKAITVGRIGTEFVLHIPEEYDYRYASPDKREKIILMILKGWTSINKSKMPIYFKN
jgi:serum/glucocorticoid-regulated kinase 2